jgi:hypothetical protein
MEQEHKMIMSPSTWERVRPALREDATSFKQPKQSSVYMPFMEFPMMPTGAL